MNRYEKTRTLVEERSLKTPPLALLKAVDQPASSPVWHHLGTLTLETQEGCEVCVSGQCASVLVPAYVCVCLCEWQCACVHACMCVCVLMHVCSCLQGVCVLVGVGSVHVCSCLLVCVCSCMCVAGAGLCVPIHMCTLVHVCVVMVLCGWGQTEYSFDVFKLRGDGIWNLALPRPREPAQPTCIHQAPCASAAVLMWPRQTLYLMSKLRNVTSHC